MGAAKKFKDRVRKIIEKELEEYFDTLEGSDFGKTVYRKFDSPSDCVLDFSEALTDCMKSRGAEEPASNQQEDNEEEIEEKKPGRKFIVRYQYAPDEYHPNGTDHSKEITAASENHARRMFLREHKGANIESVTEITTFADV